MRELYFFRNMNNYQELIEKTRMAYERLSNNKRKAIVSYQIEVSCEEFAKISLNLKKSSDIIIQYINVMKIEDGIWKCIELKSGALSLWVMADGYPYPKFVALEYLL